MSNNGKLGMGTVLKIGPTGGQTVINGVTVIPPLARKKPKIDTTNYGSNGKQYKSGLEEADDMQFTIQFDPADAGHAAIKAAYDSGALTHFQLVYPYGVARNVDFDAVVVDWVENDAMENIMLANFTLALTVSSIAYS